jgi:hypothetical protein
VNNPLATNSSLLSEVKCGPYPEHTKRIPIFGCKFYQLQEHITNIRTNINLILIPFAANNTPIVQIQRLVYI